MVNKTITYNYQNSNSELVRFSYFYSKVVPIIGGFPLRANVWQLFRPVRCYQQAPECPTQWPNSGHSVWLASDLPLRHTAGGAAMVATTGDPAVPVIIRTSKARGAELTSS